MKTLSKLQKVTEKQYSKCHSENEKVDLINGGHDTKDPHHLHMSSRRERSCLI